MSVWKYHNIILPHIKYKVNDILFGFYGLLIHVLIAASTPLCLEYILTTI